MFEITGDSQWCYLKDLYLNGRKTEQSAGDYLLYIDAGYPILENIYVMYAYETGIRISSQDFHCLNVYSEFCGKHGWHVTSFQNGQLIDCTAWDNGELGLQLAGKRGTINNFRSMMNGKEGIFVSSGHKFFFHGCYIQENGEIGLHMHNSDHISVTDCIIRDNSQTTDNTYDGIYFNGNNEDITIKGNKIYSTNDPANDQRDGIRVDGTSDNIQIALNHILDNDGYGINIVLATNVGTLAKDNDLSGNGNGPLNDDGIGTKLAIVKGSFPMSNVGGGTAAVAPVINTSPGGIDIDANDEFTHVKIPLPAEAQQVVRLKVWAYSNVIEATNNMLLRIVAHGAGSNELWSGNAIDVANKPSVEEGGIVQYDVIHWVIDVNDDAQIGTLTAQDLIEFLVVGEAASAPDIATDALFGGYEIEYV